MKDNRIVRLPGTPKPQTPAYTIVDRVQVQVAIRRGWPLLASGVAVAEYFGLTGYVVSEMERVA